MSYGFLDILTRATTPLSVDAVSCVHSFYCDKRGYSFVALDAIRRSSEVMRKRIVVEIWYRALWKRDENVVVEIPWPLRCSFPTYYNESHEWAAIRTAARTGVVMWPEKALHESTEEERWDEACWPLNLA